MPRFYVDLDDGETASSDLTGSEQADDEAARRKAIALLVDRVRRTLPDGNVRQFRADLRDEDRKVIFRATIALTALWVRDAPEGD